jgi:hypothetical protein
MPVTCRLVCRFACLFACFSVSAAARSNTQEMEEANRSVGAIDASVHVEVDEQNRKPAAAGASLEQAAGWRSRMATEPILWPAVGPTAGRAHAETCGGVSNDLSAERNFAGSSFRSGVDPGAEPEVRVRQRTSSQWQFAASSSSASANHNDSGQDQGGIGLWHGLRGTGKPACGAAMPLTLRTTIEVSPSSNQSPGYGAPFGHAQSELAAANPFLKKNVFAPRYQARVKRQQRRANQSATIAGSKSSLESLASTSR